MSRLSGLLFLLLAMVSGPAAMADAVQVRGAPHGDYGRIAFNWEYPVPFTAEAAGRQLTVRFGRPIEADFAAAVRSLPGYLQRATPGGDGRSVIFTMTGEFQIRSFNMGAAVVVDILGAPQSSGRAPTPSPPQARTPTPAATPAPGAETLPVRVGRHADFTRIVFDWPRKVDYGVAEGDGEVTVIFARGANPDLRAINSSPPPFVRGASSEMKGPRLAVILRTDKGAGVKHFLSGNSVVVDIQRPTARTAPPAATPPPAPAPVPAVSPPPTPTEPEPTPEAPPTPTASDGRPMPLVPQTPASQPTAAPAAQVAAPGEILVSLRFDWDEPVAAAVFSRGGGLWVVFDKAVVLDPSLLQQAGGGVIGRVIQVPSPDGTVLRMDVNPGVHPGLRRDGLAWILDLATAPYPVASAIETKAQPSSPIGARIFVPVLDPGRPIAVTDPEVGDNIVIVPVVPLGHGVPERVIYPQLEVLPTAQGVVIKPWIDDLRVRPLRQGIELTAARQLQISEVSAQAAAGTRIAAPTTLSRVFDLEKWRQGTLRDFYAHKTRLEKAVVAAAEGKPRQNARRDLARFLFASGFGAEALGVLDVMQSFEPEIAGDPEYRAMRGASQFLMARLEDAKEEFAHESLRGNDEAAFWLAAVRAAAREPADGPDELRRGGPLLRAYPKALMLPLGLLVADATIDAGDAKQAEHYLQILKVEELSPREDMAWSHVAGRLMALAGDFEGAVAEWEKVIAGPHPPSQAKSAVERGELLYKLDRIPRAELIEELEKLRFAWRGDDFEFDLLRRLGTLYLEEGGFRDGLHTLRQAATHFREHPEATKITQQMADAFAGLYLENGADALPPVTAIALYDEFKELTPAGARGDEMIRKLADRLAGVDLLEQAAELLEAQVQYRLTGIDKARVGARLALVQLLDRKPEKALEVLKATDMPDLPPELESQRRHLQSRVLSHMQRYEDALILLKGDQSLDADLLRADIFWETRAWTEAAQSLRRLADVHGAAPNRPLDQRQARYILNTAVALTLAGNERGIARLRQDFEAAMGATQLADAFRLIANPKTGELIDYASIASRVAEAEKFQGFMSAYRQRLKTNGLSGIN